MAVVAIAVDEMVLFAGVKTKELRLSTFHTGLTSLVSSWYDTHDLLNKIEPVVLLSHGIISIPRIPAPDVSAIRRPSHAVASMIFLIFLSQPIIA